MAKRLGNSPMTSTGNRGTEPDQPAFKKQARSGSIPRRTRGSASLRSARRPGKALVHEVEGADAEDGVRAVEPLDLGAVAEAQVVVAALHFCKLIPDPFL